MPADTRLWFAPLAWVHGAWARDVLLAADAQGHWSRIDPGAEACGATVLNGPVLPGLVNAHSHAFQRAMAGLAERSAGSDDDFWSWRDRMYRVALRITPPQLEAVAAWLYAELLRSGYTQVCEFHYLHDGGCEMANALVRAAQRVGIGLTLLPALYMRSGFGAKDVRGDQRRFVSTPQSVMNTASAVRGGGAAHVNSGIAIHSLRAADIGAVRELTAAAQQMPIHIHLAEQRREVDDCLLAHGRTPVEFLLAQVSVDRRWNLVHATQCTPGELTSLRNTGAAIVLCPTTEANLGDGIFDLPAWMGQSGNWSIGSDSHVTRSWREELRLLEYSQRLKLGRRNVSAAAALTGSSAGALFEGALQGGSAAAGVRLGGLQVGERADFLVLDSHAPELAGVPDGSLLDALVFSSPESRFARTFVAAEEVLAKIDAGSLADGMRRAMREIWAG